MNIKGVLGVAALGLLVVAVTALPSKSTEGSAQVQLLSFMAPVKRPAQARDADDFPNEMPITIVLEVIDARQAAAVCELTPRIRDAVMEALFFNPIPVGTDRRLDVSRIEPILLKATNKALRGRFVSAVVEQGAKPLQTSSSRSRAAALGCAVKPE